MTNRLLEDLPTIEAHGGIYIDSAGCSQLWREDGASPECLAAFLKRYPVGYYLSWVQSEIGKWFAGKMTIGNESNLNLIGQGLSGGKNDSGLRQLVTDFEIYRDANRLCQKGYKLDEPGYENSVFLKLEKMTRLPWKRFFAGKKSKGKSLYGHHEL